MSLRSDYEARWRNPLTAAVVLTFDICAERGATVSRASTAAGLIFGVQASDVRDVIAATMDDAIQRLRDEAA